MKKSKDLWEHILAYPSFNLRFSFVVVVILLLFSGIAYFLYPTFSTVSDKLTFLNLIVQGATLILAIFAAYYALRQLVETRFIGLDQSAMADLKNMQYFSAIKKWKEAFYIKPEARIFSNLAESFLLLGDLDMFDQHMKMLGRGGLTQINILQETSDQLAVLYLKCVRYLLVENLGEAKEILKQLVKIGKDKDTLIRFRWDFSDIQSCEGYRNLTGDSKIISNNLFVYLQRSMSARRKQEFESGTFSSVAD